MSGAIQDAVGRLPWVCRSCHREFWSSCNGAGFGCHHCGAGNVETCLGPATWVGPTDQRLTAALAEASP